MTREKRQAIARWAKGAALAALAFGCAAGAPVSAQDTAAQGSGSMSDFRLPQPTPSAAPAEGPVDPEYPVAAPTSPAPRTSASPAIVLPVEPAPPRESARRAPVTQPPIAYPSNRPIMRDMLPPGTEPGPAMLPDEEPTVAASEAPVPSAPRDEGLGWWFPLLLGLLSLAAVGGFFWRLTKSSTRRRATEAIVAPRPKPAAQPEPEAAAAPAQPPAPEPKPQPEPVPETIAKVPAPEPEPQPVSEPAPAAMPLPHPAFGISPLEFGFTPAALRLSLFYATLTYRLEMTNRGDTPLTALRIAGDMISAHASVPIGQQLSLEHVALEPKHEIAALAPGETATLSGELQIALASILPVQAGAARLFVPLVRFHAEADGFGETLVFSLGQPSERSEEAMAAFRLDLGPRTFREIAQREVDIARWLPAEARRRFG